MHSTNFDESVLYKYNNTTKYRVMVLNVDGNSEHAAHAGSKIRLFGEKKIQFMDEIIECITQNKLNRDCSLCVLVYLSNHLV